MIFYHFRDKGLGLDYGKFIELYIHKKCALQIELQGAFQYQIDIPIKQNICFVSYMNRHFEQATKYFIYTFRQYIMQ